LESAFGRLLAPWYFDEKRIICLYLDGDYRGVAILTSEGGCVPYLDKFAVAPGTRGNGVARELWERLKDKNPALYWRSRQGNPINSWYRQQANGSRQAQAWEVFWYGLTPSQANACFNRALGIAPSFLDPP